jgi:hypothetical protein
MYAYTIVGAGGIGLALLVTPNTAMSFLGIPTEEPIVAGVAYSACVAFGILSILGLRSPMKFVPVLLLQFAYKVVWFTAVIALRAVTGALPSFGFTMIAIFALCNWRHNRYPMALSSLKMTQIHKNRARG